MKSKISCWRLVRSISCASLSRWIAAARTCVRTVAPGVDGCKAGAIAAGGGRAVSAYTRPPAPVAELVDAQG